MKRRPPPRGLVQFTTRVPKATMDRVGRVLRKMRNDDPDASVNTADAVRHLIGVGLTQHEGKEARKAARSVHAAKAK